MITKKLIEKIEGEAELFFKKENGLVSFATIAFPHFRGFENFLVGKNALDALVLTPRICGICGHSHLYATARALEDIYKNAGISFSLSQKAYKVREITLALEHLQNHIKWIYFTIIPSLESLMQKTERKNQLKAAHVANLASKIIALFSGQYPHSSYMLPGGITSDFTYMEIVKARDILTQLRQFVEKEFLGTTIEEFLSFSSCKDLNILKSDLGFIEKTLINLDMHHKGYGLDRFLALGEHTFNTPAKIKKTVKQAANTKHISHEKAYVPTQTSYAMNTLYKNEFIEVGPLARAMANGYGLIKNMHRRYKDSTYSRVLARIYEMIHLIQTTQDLLHNLNLDGDSIHPLRPITKITGNGIGVVEAPRGSLIHNISIRKGIITSYSITTPTQFNLASSTKKKPSAAQNGMKGVTEEEAGFIFRSFDVCSVCTTH